MTVRKVSQQYLMSDSIKNGHSKLIKKTFYRKLVVMVKFANYFNQCFVFGVT